MASTTRPALPRPGTLAISSKREDLRRCEGPPCFSVAEQAVAHLVIDRDLLPLPALLDAQARVAARRHCAKLALQFAVAFQARGIELRGVDGGLDCAAGLAAVLAIVETA